MLIDPEIDWSSHSANLCIKLDFVENCEKYDIKANIFTSTFDCIKC